MPDDEQKIELLKFLLQDVQETIRAADKKAEVNIAVVAIVTTLVGSAVSADFLIIDGVPYPGVVIAGLVLLFLALGTSILTLSPVSAPYIHAPVGKNRMPKLRLYFDSVVDNGDGNRSNRKDSPAPGFWKFLFPGPSLQLRTDLSSFHESIEAATMEDVAVGLAYEVLKTSFIRNRKLALVRYSYVLLAVGLGLWIVWTVLVLCR